MPFSALAYFVKGQSLGFVFVSICLTTDCASANEVSEPINSSNTVSSSVHNLATSALVKPGPLESERSATLIKIQKAIDKGIGIKLYMAAFLDLEREVEKGATLADIQARLESIEAALDKQLPLLNNGSNSSRPTSDTGIVGLKFKLEGKKPPEVMAVFEDGPAASAQLKVEDVITQIDGCSTQGLDIETLYRMLIGKPGTKVNLTIIRGNTTVKKILTRIRAKNYAKIHPEIWNMYRSTM